MSRPVEIEQTGKPWKLIELIGGLLMVASLMLWAWSWSTGIQQLASESGPTQDWLAAQRLIASICPYLFWGGSSTLCTGALGAWWYNG